MKQKITLSAAITTATVIALSAGCSSNSPSLNTETDNALGENTAVRASDKLITGQQQTQQQLSTSPPPTLSADINNRESEVQSSKTVELLANRPSQSRNRVEGIARQQLPAPASGSHIIPDYDRIISPIANTENYQDLQNNPIVRVAEQSTSTFSIDVDTGSYANVRRILNAGQMPPENAVRLEEMLNYFDYNYPTPDKGAHPFSITTELASTPWNTNTRLLHVGLKGYEIDKNQRPAANLVFLIDVSGSMSAPNKLGLLKSSIKMLTKELNQNDSVSIVVYAGASGVVLEPSKGNNTRKINRALDELQAGGSTNGEAGIQLAYALAEQKMSDDSINRIILATDGDFNVGVSNIDSLKKLISQKRQSGIALTTLGFGSGNYNDHLMEQLADVGNGNYAYIDTLNEARKVLSEQMNSTLMTIAKDVKIQIEFNPAQVSEYRLLGYINRTLANEDFANDKVDAGEIGAGHSVTALYEVALVGEGGERHSTPRYGQSTHVDKSDRKRINETDNGRTQEIAEIRLRYKNPSENSSQLVNRIVQQSELTTDISNTSDNFRFSAAVAGFAQLLRSSNYMNDFGYDGAAELAITARGPDRFGYRAEFVQLIDLANELDQQNQAQFHKPNHSNEG